MWRRVYLMSPSCVVTVVRFLWAFDSSSMNWWSMTFWCPALRKSELSWSHKVLYSSSSVFERLCVLMIPLFSHQLGDSNADLLPLSACHRAPVGPPCLLLEGCSDETWAFVSLAWHRDPSLNGLLRPSRSRELHWTASGTDLRSHLLVVFALSWCLHVYPSPKLSLITQTDNVVSQRKTITEHKNDFYNSKVEDSMELFHIFPK